MSWLFKEPAHVQLYFKYRPVYPPSLYTIILDYLSDGVAPAARPRPKLAVDVGCGSGQNTLALAALCESVVGVDVNEAQLDEARQASVGHANVTYRAGEGHDLAFVPDGSVDLVTVAQALHWFDLEKFYPECKRVLRKGGVLVGFGYSWATVANEEANDIVVKLCEETFRDYWEIQTRHLLNAYSELHVEFARAFPQSKRIDDLSMERTYGVEEFVGYLRSTSGYQKYRTINKFQADPLVEVLAKFQKIFAGSASDTPVHASFQTFMLMGRND